MSITDTALAADIDTITDNGKSSKLSDHSRFITVANDVNLYVEDTGGTGRPVVLIHGWPLSGASWQNQISDFVDAGYRVITYDRRGFGRSDKPDAGYDYDTFASDLRDLIQQLDLQDFSLVGFSMGGGEVARYIGNYGEDGVHSIVLASAVTPYMAKTADNPEGPLDEATAEGMLNGLDSHRDSFLQQFVNDFYTANGELKVTQGDVDQALDLAEQSAQQAAVGAMQAFGTTDFREDLKKVTVPTLIIHGSADAIVPLEGSAKLTQQIIDHAEIEILDGAPHGVNVSDTDRWNNSVLGFLDE